MRYGKRGMIVRQEERKETWRTRGRNRKVHFVIRDSIYSTLKAHLQHFYSIFTIHHSYCADAEHVL